MPLAPPVGVVIANHNNCAFIEKAIESVARRTVHDLQVVVVDASTDRSDEAIRHCLAHPGDPRFRYVKLETNLGQTGALGRDRDGTVCPRRTHLVFLSPARGRG